MDVNELLDKNEIPLKKLYEFFQYGTKRFLTLKDAVELVNNRAQMKISDNAIGACYAFSMMTIMDTVKDGNKANQMKYVEYLEFIGRVSNEYFKGTDEENMLLHDKIDRVLGLLFKVINSYKHFTYMIQSQSGFIAQRIPRKASSGGSSYIETAESFYQKNPLLAKYEIQKRELAQGKASYQNKNL